MRQNLTSICCGSSNATCLVYDYIKCGAIFSWWSTHTIHRTNPLQCLVSFNCQHRTCTWASVTGMDCSTTVLITTLNFKWLLFERRWPRFRFFFFLFCSFLCFLLIQVNLFSNSIQCEHTLALTLLITVFNMCTKDWSVWFLVI